MVGVVGGRGDGERGPHGAGRACAAAVVPEECCGHDQGGRQCGGTDEPGESDERSSSYWAVACDAKGE